MRGLIIGLVCLCSGTMLFAPTAGAAPAAVHGASTPTAPVKAVVAYVKHGGGRGCSQSWKCIPLTSRLIRRIQVIERHEHGVDPLFRVQNFAHRNTVRLLSNRNGVALVEWTAYFSPPWHLTYVVKDTSDGWRIEGNYCSGRPSTDLYRAGPVPCA
jgi:hypothetical protein